MAQKSKKKVGTRETHSGIEMVLIGHTQEGRERWKSAAIYDRPKSAERNKANAYYAISTPAGMLLNEQKTDFNVSKNHVAKFGDPSDARKWIEENNHRFKSISTGLPMKLAINKFVS